MSVIEHSRCDGSFACLAPTHIEGCFTGDGHPDAIPAEVNETVVALRNQLRGAVEALREIAEADPVDMALDPTWAARVAREAWWKATTPQDDGAVVNPLSDQSGFVPRATILLYLQDAIQTEIGEYVRAPGNRDHDRERIQDAAMAFVRGLASDEEER
jgi:hypothetical protein